MKCNGKISRQVSTVVNTKYKLAVHWRHQVTEALHRAQNASWESYRKKNSSMTAILRRHWHWHIWLWCLIGVYIYIYIAMRVSHLHPRFTWFSATKPVCHAQCKLRLMVLESSLIVDRFVKITPPSRTLQIILKATQSLAITLECSTPRVQIVTRFTACHLIDGRRSVRRYQFQWAWL